MIVYTYMRNKTFKDSGLQAVNFISEMTSRQPIVGKW